MRALVTGGNGFLGRALVGRLLREKASVRVLARSDYARDGVECLRGDVSDREAVRRAVEGVDVIFHVAAKTGVGGRFEDYVKTNLTGTEVLLDEARRAKVARLVHTSTPSVVFDRRGHEGADESTPLVTNKLSAYAWTKARAEEKVLAAHGDGISTCALRPHLVWGPDDTQLVARILERAKKGRLRLISGGHSKVDAVYVDNAIDAHLLAAEAVTGKAGGRAYFIGNADPRPIKDILGAILRAGGLPDRLRSVPLPLAYALGFVLEQVYAGRDEEPMMTRFLALQLGTPHHFDGTRARDELGYAPRVGMDEGMERLAAWLRARA